MMCTYMACIISVEKFFFSKINFVYTYCDRNQEKQCKHQSLILLSRSAFQRSGNNTIRTDNSAMDNVFAEWVPVAFHAPADIYHRQRTSRGGQPTKPGREDTVPADVLLPGWRQLLQLFTKRKRKEQTWLGHGVKWVQVHSCVCVWVCVYVCELKHHECSEQAIAVMCAAVF